MSLCRENSSNDFLFVFSFSRTKKIIILTENHKEEYVGKKIIKISSRLKPIKPQCSAGLALVYNENLA